MATQKAMILAAGRGERMRPLTDTQPKPLLKVGNRCLIEYHLLAMADAGIHDVVINLAYKGDMIQNKLGDGDRYNLKINYSHEGSEPLGTGAGIITALPLLGDLPFLLVNADIWTDFSFSDLHLPNGQMAQLVMISNPDHNPQGDFSLNDLVLSEQGSNMLTYSGIGIYNPKLFAGMLPENQALAPILKDAMKSRSVSGMHYTGQWQDIGNPDKLERLNKQIKVTG